MNKPYDFNRKDKSFLCSFYVQKLHKTSPKEPEDSTNCLPCLGHLKLHRSKFRNVNLVFRLKSKRKEAKDQYGWISH